MGAMVLPWQNLKFKGKYAFSLNRGSLMGAWGSLALMVQGTLQSNPTPPVGSRHSCQPAVKLHILLLVNSIYYP